MTTIAYLGPLGSFSHLAAQLILRSSVPDGELVPYSDFIGLLEAVNRGEIDYGVTPVENSIEGSVTVVLDTLALDVDLTVMAELVLPVHHQLVVKPGTEAGLVKEVLSHPQALAQCRKYLRKHLPDAGTRATSSTSEAAQQVRDGAGDIAAIANSLAAALYGLDVLDTGIEDNSSNATRFLLVSRKGKDVPSPESSRFKTSIVFTTKTERAGILYETLWEFADRKINLTRIESRPAKRVLGEYMFYLDMDGALCNSLIADACEKVKEKAKFFKVLGSYPVLERAGDVLDGRGEGSSELVTGTNG